MTFTKTMTLFMCLLLPATGVAYDLQFENKDYGKLDGQIKGLYVSSVSVLCIPVGAAISKKSGPPHPDFYNRLSIASERRFSS